MLYDFDERHEFGGDVCSLLDYVPRGLYLISLDSFRKYWKRPPFGGGITCFFKIEHGDLAGEYFASSYTIKANSKYKRSRANFAVKGIVESAMRAKISTVEKFSELIGEKFLGYMDVNAGKYGDEGDEDRDEYSHVNILNSFRGRTPEKLEHKLTQINADGKDITRTKEYRDKQREIEYAEEQKLFEAYKEYRRNRRKSDYKKYGAGGPPKSILKQRENEYKKAECKRRMSKATTNLEREEVEKGLGIWLPK